MERQDSITILLVEDSPSDAELIGAYLEDFSSPEIRLERVDTLATALSALAEKPIDLVLLDLNLPDSCGLETFRTLQAGVSDVPIIVLSGETNECLAVKAVREGAEDYLFKESQPNQLLTRSVRFAIERHRRQQAEHSLRSINEGFRAARNIQQALLPNEAPAVDGFDIAGGCHPAEATGGDYFDYIPMKDGRMGVVVGDVSSHGFAPALIMAGTRRLLRTLAETHDDLAEILKVANQAVAEDTQTEHFVTLFFAGIHPQTGSLTYAGAGHPAYVVDRQGNIRRLQSTGFPLGLLPDVPPVGIELTELQAGEMLVLLTDGFQESQNAHGELFGTERLLDLVASRRDQSAETIVNTLFRTVRGFCHPHLPQDDMTAVILKTRQDA